VRRAAAWLGLGAVCLYAVVAALTLALTRHDVRPLFDSITPPVRYNWMKPPPEFSLGNVIPKLKVGDIPLSSTVTGSAVAPTDDGQFVVNFAQGSLPAHDGDTKVHWVITPLDPATVASPPVGLAADGNAYRIDLTYEPSGTSVGALAVPGDVIMTSPHNSVAMMYSANGTSWQKLASQQVGGPTTIGTTFTSPGYYLVASKPQTGAKGGGSGTVLIAVSVALGAALLGLIAWILANRWGPSLKRPNPSQRPRPQRRR
jgi:hypothetical protein